MGIGTRLNRLRDSWKRRRAERRTLNEPDASAGRGLRQPGRSPTWTDSDIASDGTPFELRSPESRDQDR